MAMVELLYPEEGGKIAQLDYKPVPQYTSSDEDSRHHVIEFESHKMSKALVATHRALSELEKPVPFSWAEKRARIIAKLDPAVRRSIVASEACSTVTLSSSPCKDAEATKNKEKTAGKLRKQKHVAHWSH